MNRSVFRPGLAVLLAAFAGSLLVAYAGQGTAKSLTQLGPWFAGAYVQDGWREVLFEPALSVFLFVVALAWLLRRDSRPWRGSAQLAIICSGGLLLLCAVAVVRVIRHRPIDHFLEELGEATQEIPRPGIPRSEQQVVATQGPNGPTLLLPTTAYDPGSLGRRNVEIGGVTVIQQCEQEGCKIFLVQNPEEFFARFRGRGDAWSAALRDAPRQGWGHTVQFAKDPEEPVLYVSGFGFEKPNEYHLELGQYRSSQLDASRIAARTSPPRSWLGLGLFGLALIGVLFAVRRRRARKGISHLDAAVTGTREEDGSVTLADGRRRLAPPALFPLPGPAPVLVLRPSPGTVYREDTVLRPEDILPGTLEEHLSKHRNGLLHLDAIIVTCALLFGAPLAGAAAAGLVF